VSLLFFIDIIYVSFVELNSKRNKCQDCFLWGKLGRCVGLKIVSNSWASCLEILGLSTSWKPQGLSRPIKELRKKETQSVA
jgi:hypothetical protein